MSEHSKLRKKLVIAQALTGAPFQREVLTTFVSILLYWIPFLCLRLWYVAAPQSPEDWGIFISFRLYGIIQNGEEHSCMVYDDKAVTVYERFK